MVPIDENKFRPISFSNTSGTKEQDPTLVRAEGNAGCGFCAHRNTPSLGSHDDVSGQCKDPERLRETKSHLGIVFLS